MSRPERLPTEHYARVFDVLERCDSATSFSEFKELLLDSLTAVFGYEHVISVGEAKRIVHQSRAWADAREDFEKVQNEVATAASQL